MPLGFLTFSKQAANHEKYRPDGRVKGTPKEVRALAGQAAGSTARSQRPSSGGPTQGCSRNPQQRLPLDARASTSSEGCVSGSGYVNIDF